MITLLPSKKNDKKTARLRLHCIYLIPLISELSLIRYEAEIPEPLYDVKQFLLFHRIQIIKELQGWLSPFSE